MTLRFVVKLKVLVTSLDLEKHMINWLLSKKDI
jgi:hypothetical protein